MTDQTTLVFIGTQDTGIHAARLDERMGDIRPLGPVATVERPTWVLADRGRRVLYSVSEVGNAGDRIGEVMSFAIDSATPALCLLGRTSSGGGGPTHTAIGPAADALFVANFGGGQVSVVPLSPDGAPLSPGSVRINHGSGPHRRQQGPHAHGVTLDPSGRFLLAPDMGADRIFVYPYDHASQTLGETVEPLAGVPAGAGPRLILFGKDGRFAYLLTELSAEIFIFGWDEGSGALTLAGSVPLDPPEAGDNRSAAGFAMSEDGRFLYATNRITHAIHVFAIHAPDGQLTPVQTLPSGGHRPWAVEIAPSGRWLLAANQASDGVALFAVDLASGQLSPTDRAWQVPTPTSFAFLPALA